MGKMIKRISNYLSYICVISVVLYSLNNSYAVKIKYTKLRLRAY